jgi:hypothetical protein
MTARLGKEAVPETNQGWIGLRQFGNQVLNVRPNVAKRESLQFIGVTAADDNDL